MCLWWDELEDVADHVETHLRKNRDEHVCHQRNERGPAGERRTKASQSSASSECADLQKVKRDCEERWNHHGPREHAPRAQRTDDINALRDEPGDKAHAENESSPSNEPEPAGEACSGKQCDAEDDGNHPARQSDERIGEPEDGTLVGRQVRGAADQNVEVAAEFRIRILQLSEFVESQGKSGDPSRYPRDDEKDRQGNGTGIIKCCVARFVHVRDYGTGRCVEGT